MADYDNLSDTIGKMKRAAIDCWMADDGFYPNWGNDQIYAKWSWMLNFYNRPDANGNGGGDGNGVNHSVADSFDQIRAAIDSTVSKWLDLPDGTKCDTPRADAKTTAAMLGDSDAGPSVEGSGDLATSNGTIHEVVVNNFKGSFKGPFLDKYYTQLSKVTQGLGSGCVILEANYAAQREMWPAAREDVAAICASAHSAWKQRAGEAAEANNRVLLSVVAAVAGAVASVVTAGTGTVATVAALSTVAAAANSAVEAISAETDVTGGSYGEILSSLDAALETLNTTIHEQEEALDTMLTSASSTMNDDLASFDLGAFSLGEYSTDEGVIEMDRSDTDIVSNNMVRVEDALAAASTTLGSPPLNPTRRSAGIGLGTSGTHTAASGLYSLISQSLDNTAAAYTLGHELFNATVDDFFETEAEIQKKISDLLAEEALNSEAGA